MTGREPLPRDYQLASLIMELLTALGVVEVSRKAIFAFLWRPSAKAAAWTVLALKPANFDCHLPVR